MGCGGSKVIENNLEEEEKFEWQNVTHVLIPIDQTHWKKIEMDASEIAKIITDVRRKKQNVPVASVERLTLEEVYRCLLFVHAMASGISMNMSKKLSLSRLYRANICLIDKEDGVHGSDSNIELLNKN